MTDKECSECGKIVPEVEMIATMKGGWVCGECAEDLYDPQGAFEHFEEEQELKERG